MKRIALFVALAVVSLATLPYSLPVIGLAAVVVHIWRKRATVPRHVLFRRELDALERRLRDEIRATELLAKIKYTKWKLDKEAERQYYIEHGVRFPRTAWQDEQDAFFATLEFRLTEEQRVFQEKTREIEYQERLKIEDQRREASAVETTRLAEQQQQLQASRLQAEREAAEKIAAALRDDLR